MKEPPTTEQRNPASVRLDGMPVESILRLMNEEDRKVPLAVTEALPLTVEAVELPVVAWRGGALDPRGRRYQRPDRRPGRRGMPPTFGVPPDRVLALLAGGRGAVSRAVEAAEDGHAAAVRDLEDLGLSPSDVVAGLAASGRTPYAVAAVEHAAGKGAPPSASATTPGAS